MEIFTYILTAILAIALIVAGISLCWRKQPAKTPTVTAVLSIGFLMLLLLHMSKFKHVTGFGFEAETWDEKQVEAAKLVDQLSITSEALNQQIALLASRLGVWGPGFTNPEMIDLLQEMKRQLQAAATPKTRIDEITAPVRRRIALNYWFKATSMLQAMYWQEHLDLQKQQGHAEQDAELLKERDKLLPVPSDIPRTLEPLIAIVKSSKVFNPSPEFLHQLNELDQDLRFFIASGESELRRKINLDEAYPEQWDGASSQKP
jgi:hypothetical protein